MRTILTVILLTLSLSSQVWAQELQPVEISSSPNPVGSGARALGMGGAFIGVADDATAASWNPAGLIQLETPEVSIVGAYNKRTEDRTYKAIPEASGPQSTNTHEINYLSVAYPFTALNRNMIVSLSFQHLYDFNKKVNYVSSNTTGTPLSLKYNSHYDQEGAFKSLSPAFAFQVTPSLSLGVTLNLWNCGAYRNKWESTWRISGNGTFGVVPISVQNRIDDKYEMKGLRMDLSDPLHWQNANYNMGLLWHISPAWTLGAVFKAPFVAKLQHDQHFNQAITFPTNPADNSYSERNRSETVKLDMPMSYGLGIALRLSDRLTFDLDVYRTEWGDYVLHDADGYELSPITGKLRKDSDISATTQVRIGGEYLIIGESTVIPIRAGVFYDPEPADGSPGDCYGFSIGSGIAYKNIVYDVAYQYRLGRDVRTVTVGNADYYSENVKQHTIYMSAIYHF